MSWKDPNFKDQIGEGLVNVHCQACGYDELTSGRYAGETMSCIACGEPCVADELPAEELARIRRHYGA